MRDAFEARLDAKRETIEQLQAGYARLEAENQRLHAGRKRSGNLT